MKQTAAAAAHQASMTSTGRPDDEADGACPPVSLLATTAEALGCAALEELALLEALDLAAGLLAGFASALEVLVEAVTVFALVERRGAFAGSCASATRLLGGNPIV